MNLCMIEGLIRFYCVLRKRDFGVEERVFFSARCKMFNVKSIEWDELRVSIKCVNDLRNTH